MLFTDVIRPVHGREQLKISVSYSYFPYRKKQRRKRLKRTLVLSYGWLHYRQQTNYPFGERWKPSFLLWRRKEKVQKSIIPKPGLFSQPLPTGGDDRWAPLPQNKLTPIENQFIAYFFPFVSSSGWPWTNKPAIPAWSWFLPLSYPSPEAESSRVHLPVQSA